MSVNGGAGVDCVRMLQGWEVYIFHILVLYVESVYHLCP